MYRFFLPIPEDAFGGRNYRFCILCIPSWLYIYIYILYYKYIYIYAHGLRMLNGLRLGMVIMTMTDVEFRNEP